MTRATCRWCAYDSDKSDVKPGIMSGQRPPPVVHQATSRRAMARVWREAESHERIARVVRALKPAPAAPTPPPTLFVVYFQVSYRTQSHFRCASLDRDSAVEMAMALDLRLDRDGKRGFHAVQAYNLDELPEDTGPPETPLRREKAARAGGTAKCFALNGECINHNMCNGAGRCAYPDDDADADDEEST